MPERWRRSARTANGHGNFVETPPAFAHHATMVLPPALQKGDVIGIAAPSSAFDRAAFDAGVAWLQTQGFRVRYRADIHDREHYLAGSRERRIAELEELFTSPDIRAVFFARGGYGVMQLLPDLVLPSVDTHPLVVLGHSDLTPLLNHITEMTRLVTFHGPLVAGLHKTSASSLAQMMAMLTRPHTIPGPVAAGTGGSICLSEGRATGRLCGGNLSLIAATLGTPFELDTRGKILFLEDIGERPYRVDRLLTQLQLAGKLQQAAGVAFGEMVDCVEPGAAGRPVVDILEQFAQAIPGPVVHGLPFGHGENNATLPIGALATLDGNKGTLEIREPVVA